MVLNESNLIHSKPILSRFQLFLYIVSANPIGKIYKSSSPTFTESVSIIVLNLINFSLFVSFFILLI